MTHHIALNFGDLRNFNQGIGEYSRQLASHIAERAPALSTSRDWRFHFYLPTQWHGVFGDAVSYHAVSARMRFPYRGRITFDLWHDLHQHLRYRPPLDSRCNLLTIHDLHYAHIKKGWSLQRHRLRHRRCVNRANHIITVSQWTRADLIRHFPEAAHAEVIHNGVADLSQTPVSRVPSLEGMPFFLHISRMSRNKNVESLLALAHAWPEKRFVLAGPNNRHVLGHQAYCRERKLENVMFLTDVSEGVKAWLYANCDVFLFPSTHEGFGIPPIEAMYFGKPVMVTRAASLPEVCGGAARYWDDLAPAAMRAELSLVLRQLESGGWAADDARRQAMRYQWHRVGGQYLETYARCIERH